MSSPYDAGALIGQVIGLPIFYLVIMLGAAWVLDRILVDYLDDYVLAFVSFLPAALIILLVALAGLGQGEPGSADRISGWIRFGAAILAAVVGFVNRIASVDEEFGENG